MNELINDRKREVKLEKEEKFLIFPPPVGTISENLIFNRSLTLSSLNPIIFNNTQLCLGEGTYSKVYLIEHKTTKKLYAMKIMDKKEIKEITNNYQLIYNEINIQGRIKHPNIIRLFNCIEDEKYFILILEYAINGSLFYLLKENCGFNEETAFYYFIQVVNAIYFLHSNGIIHRDLKPENLLLDSDSHIKLCDFGWSVLLDEGKRSTFCGTVEYIAPEIIHKQNYDSSIDVWSLGILLYELIHSYSPFAVKDLNSEKIENKIINGKIRLKENLSPECKDLINQLLKKESSERIKIADIYKHPFILKNVNKLSKNIISNINSNRTTKCLIKNKSEKFQRFSKLTEKMRSNKKKENLKKINFVKKLANSNNKNNSNINNLIFRSIPSEPSIDKKGNKNSFNLNSTMNPSRYLSFCHKSPFSQSEGKVHFESNSKIVDFKSSFLKALSNNKINNISPNIIHYNNLQNYAKQNRKPNNGTIDDIINVNNIDNDEEPKIHMPNKQFIYINKNPLQNKNIFLSDNKKNDSKNSEIDETVKKYILKKSPSTTNKCNLLIKYRHINNKRKNLSKTKKQKKEFRENTEKDGDYDNFNNKTNIVCKINRTQSSILKNYASMNYLSNKFITNNQKKKLNLNSDKKLCLNKRNKMITSSTGTNSVLNTDKFLKTRNNLVKPSSQNSVEKKIGVVILSPNNRNIDKKKVIKSSQTIKKTNKKKLSYVNYLTTKNIFSVIQKKPKNINIQYNTYKIKTEHKIIKKTKNRISDVKMNSMNPVNIKIKQLSSRSTRHINKSVTGIKLMISSILNKKDNQNSRIKK